MQSMTKSSPYRTLQYVDILRTVAWQAYCEMHVQKIPWFGLKIHVFPGGCEKSLVQFRLEHQRGKQQHSAQHTASSNRENEDHQFFRCNSGFAPGNLLPHSGHSLVGSEN